MTSTQPLHSTLYHILKALPDGRSVANDKKQRKIIDATIAQHCNGMDSQELALHIVALLDVAQQWHPKTHHFTPTQSDLPKDLYNQSFSHFDFDKLKLQVAQLVHPIVSQNTISDHTFTANTPRDISFQHSSRRTINKQFSYHSFLYLYAIQQMVDLFLTKQPDPLICLFVQQRTAAHFFTYTQPSSYPSIGHSRKDPIAQEKAFFISTREQNAFKDQLPWTRVHQPSAIDFSFIKILTSLTQYLSTTPYQAQASKALEVTPFPTLSKIIPSDSNPQTYEAIINHMIDFLYKDHTISIHEELLANDAVAARYNLVGKLDSVAPQPIAPSNASATPSDPFSFLPPIQDLISYITNKLSTSYPEPKSSLSLQYLRHLPIISYYSHQHSGASCLYPQQVFELSQCSLIERCAHLQQDQHFLLRMLHPDFLHITSGIMRHTEPIVTSLHKDQSARLLRVLPLMAASGMPPTTFIPLACSLTAQDRIELSKKPISAGFHHAVARWFCDQSVGHPHHSRQMSALFCIAIYHSCLGEHPNNWLNTLGKTLKNDYHWHHAARYFFDSKSVAKMEALLVHKSLNPLNQQDIPPLARRNIRL